MFFVTDYKGLFSIRDYVGQLYIRAYIAIFYKSKYMGMFYMTTWDCSTSQLHETVLHLTFLGLFYIRDYKQLLYMRPRWTVLYIRDYMEHFYIS